jgi:DNA-binding transcriptional regulator YiaG
MGYLLPSGPWSMRKDDILASVLGDLKAVVVECFGGVVVGRLGNDWLRLNQFRELDETTLIHKLKVICFVPQDYRAKHRASFEDATGYRVAEDPKKAEQASWEVMYKQVQELASEADTIPSIENAFRDLPVRERIQEVMHRRKVSGAALASLFGISKMTVSNWLTGKKPIPEDAVPLLVRWVESGTAPTPEELAARRGRRPQT